MLKAPAVVPYQMSTSIKEKLEELIALAQVGVQTKSLTEVLDLFLFVNSLIENDFQKLSSYAADIKAIIYQAYQLILQFPPEKIYSDQSNKLVNCFVQYMNDCVEEDRPIFYMTMFLHKWLLQNAFWCQKINISPSRNGKKTTILKDDAILDLFLQKFKVVQNDYLTVLKDVLILKVRIAALESYQTNGKYGFTQYDEVLEAFEQYKLLATLHECITTKSNAKYLFLVIRALQVIPDRYAALLREQQKLKEKLAESQAIALSLSTDPSMTIADSADELQKKITQILTKTIEPVYVVKHIDDLSNELFPLLMKLEMMLSDNNAEQQWGLVIMNYFNSLVAICWHQTDLQAVRKKATTEIKRQDLQMQALLQAGILDPGADGDCGYTCAAFAVIIAVLTGRLHEGDRKKFYEFIQKNLNLKEPSQAALHDWLITQPFNVVVKIISQQLRKFAVACQKGKDAEFLIRFKAVYGLVQEKNRIELQLQSGLNNLTLRERLNKIADDLAFYKMHLIPEFRAIFNFANCSDMQLERFWHKNKEHFFRRIVQSADEYNDPEAAAGDVIIYATDDDLTILAQELDLAFIFEAGTTLQGRGKGFLIADELGLLTDEEKAILQKCGVGQQEQMGFRLNIFIDKSILLGLLPNDNPELNQKIIDMYESQPQFKLINLGAHWQFELKAADAQALLAMRDKLRVWFLEARYQTSVAALINNDARLGLIPPAAAAIPKQSETTTEKPQTHRP